MGAGDLQGGAGPRGVGKPGRAKGVSGGPIVGEVQRFLMEMVLEDPKLNNPEDLTVLLHFYRGWKDLGGSFTASRFEAGVYTEARLVRP